MGLGPTDQPWNSVPGGVYMPDRELIDTGSDKRYVRRDEHGRFKESDDVGRSLAADRRQKAEHESRKGQGDRGDRRD
jgi:hypothetical protein